MSQEMEDVAIAQFLKEFLEEHECAAEDCECCYMCDKIRAAIEELNPGEEPPCNTL